MAFHVKDDFKAGAPITQVPASWFNRVGSFLNNLVGGYCVKIEKNERGASTISVDTSKLPLSKDTGTPEDKTDSPEVLDTSGDSWTWTANGKDGLKLDAYYRIGTSGSYHLFQRCRLTISKDGLVVSAEGLPDRIRIRA